jgi:hypothetical protein
MAEMAGLFARKSLKLLAQAGQTLNRNRITIHGGFNGEG